MRLAEHLDFASLLHLQRHELLHLGLLFTLNQHMLFYTNSAVAWPRIIELGWSSEVFPLGPELTWEMSYRGSYGQMQELPQ